MQVWWPTLQGWGLAGSNSDHKKTHPCLRRPLSRGDGTPCGFRPSTFSRPGHGGGSQGYVDTNPQDSLQQSNNETPPRPWLQHIFINPSLWKAQPTFILTKWTKIVYLPARIHKMKHKDIIPVAWSYSGYYYRYYYAFTGMTGSGYGKSMNP